MSRNSSYWQKRFTALELAQEQKGLAYYHNLSQQYEKAVMQIQKDIDYWYSRFAKNEGISLVEAKQLLTTRELKEFRMTVEEYIEKGKTLNHSDQWTRALERASTKFHISRLEALQLQMEQQVETLMGSEVDAIDNLLRHIYTDGYYHTAFEIQKGIGIGWDLMQLDDNKISKLLAKPWAADGANFSERIWGKHKPELVRYLENDFTQSLIRGDDPQKMIAQVAKRFQVAKHKAGNLVMTESAFFASAAQKDCLNDLEVEQYEIVATLDSRTSEVCRSMDGKHFSMKEYQIGATAPPFHNRCRSTTCPYFDDEFTEDEMRAARGEDGKTYYVPADMTYSEWKKVFVDGDKAGLQEVENISSNDIIKETLLGYADSFTPAKYIDEAKEFATDILYLDYAEYDKISLEAANMLNYEIARVYDVFGNLHEAGYLRDIRYYPKKVEWEACYIPSWNGIYMRNLSGKNAIKKMERLAEEQREMGFLSTGSAEHAIRHELGHAVQHKFLNHNPDKEAKITALREKILKNHGITKWDKDYDTPEHIKQAGNSLSYYGLRNNGEFVAESVAEYMAGNPRETAKKVVTILLEE